MSRNGYSGTGIKKGSGMAQRDGAGLIVIPPGYSHSARPGGCHVDAGRHYFQPFRAVAGRSVLEPGVAL